VRKHLVSRATLGLALALLIAACSDDGDPNAGPAEPSVTAQSETPITAGADGDVDPAGSADTTVGDTSGPARSTEPSDPLEIEETTLCGSIRVAVNSEVLAGGGEPLQGAALDEALGVVQASYEAGITHAQEPLAGNLVTAAEGIGQLNEYLAEVDHDFARLVEVEGAVALLQDPSFRAAVDAVRSHSEAQC